MMTEITGGKPPMLLEAVRMIALETLDDELGHNLRLLGLPIADEASAITGATIRIRPLAMPPRAEEQEQPTIFTAESDGIEQRLACVRRGGVGLLVNPFPMDELRRVIAACQRPIGFSGRRVLVVEDDASMATVIAQTLIKAGYRVERASTSGEVIDRLMDFHPDVLLLDLHLADCSGAELALIVRQLPGFATTPILYVSGEKDPQSQIAALKCGADGFITKPIRRADLVGRIDAVVGRLAELDRLAHFDALTGVYNARASRLELQRAMSVAARGDGLLSAGLIDVDHFKKVNDVHGHLIGDRVLQRLGKLLREHFRGSDIVGRLGGEEFLVIMPGATATNAERLLDTARALFPDACRGANENVALPASTFSAGVACWDGKQSPESFLSLADQRLYRAKAEGRNRVLAA